MEKKISRQGYFVNCLQKKCAKFRKDRSSSFRVTCLTDLKKKNSSKNALKFFFFMNMNLNDLYFKAHNFVNFVPIDLKFLRDTVEILYNRMK